MSSIAPQYPELAAALRERLAAIADREHYQRDPAGHLQRLKAAAAAIEAIQQNLPPNVDARLAHFLQRASYDKALAFLESASAPQ
jgi:hypothetical protein